MLPQGKNIWMQTEFYFYGEIVAIDGCNCTIKLDVPQEGIFEFKTEKELLQQQDKNLIYQTVGIHAKGIRNLITSEIKKNSLSVIKFIEYNPVYNQNYINELVDKGIKSYSGVDVDDWIAFIRGVDEQNKGESK